MVIQTTPAIGSLEELATPASGLSFMSGIPPSPSLTERRMMRCGGRLCKAPAQGPTMRRMPGMRRRHRSNSATAPCLPLADATWANAF
jgi:hypothetical protein